jgi:hypothetical protein
MELAPVLLFVYARPSETEKTIEALSKNYLAKDSDLFVFSDGPKNDNLIKAVNNVRHLIKAFSGFKNITIIEREKNYGLAKSIISGVSEVMINYDKVIVVEEDLISSLNFLDFLNSSLIKYENNKKVFSVTGYTYQLGVPNGYKFDNYFTQRCESLGWGTWKDRWIKADWDVTDFKSFIKDKSELKKFDNVGADLIGMLLKQRLGKLDSWAVRWCYAHFRNNSYCSYPIKSKIVHIGEGGEATHVKKEVKILDTEIDIELKRKFEFADQAFLEPEIIKQYSKMFRKTIVKRFRNKIYKYKYLKHQE